MKKIIFLYLFMLFYGLYPSQDLNISISVSNSNTNKKEMYKIVESNSHIDIIFCKRDSISNAFDKDEWVLSERRSEKKLEDKNKEYMNMLRDKIEEYSYYTTEAKHFSNSTTKELKKIVLKINTTKSQDFEIKDPDPKVLRLVVDGTSCGFTIPYKGKNRDVFAVSPDSKTHPLLYELLTFCEEQFK